MLTGSELGKAVAEAIRLKGVTKVAVARHFGIKGPSIYDWIDHGRVGKQHLTQLVAYFADVVPPSHWGLDIGGPAHQLASQPERLAPTIILRAIALMRESTHKVEGRAVDVETDPELFAEMLQLAIIEASESEDGEREVREAGRQGGGTSGAKSEAEARPAARPTGGGKGGKLGAAAAGGKRRATGRAG